MTGLRSRVTMKDSANDSEFVSRLSPEELSSYYISSGYLDTRDTGTSLRELHKLFHQAIVAGHLTTRKAIGVKIKSKLNSKSNSVISRNPACLESISEIALHISDLTFIGNCGDIFKTEDFEGVGTVPEVNFVSGGEPVQLLQKSAFLTRAAKKMSIVVFTNEALGYQSVAKNATIINEAQSQDDQTFFPFSSDHTLVQHVKVLPFLGNGIFFRLEENISGEGLSLLWNKYQESRGMYSL